jgi:hypothetical protein
MTSSTRNAGWIALALVPLLFVGSALVPRRVLLPLDLKLDLGAWKADPTMRRPVSNRLLSDVVLQFYPWDVQIRRLMRAGEMPWRNAYSGDGSPLWANPQTALFSPFTTPRLLLGARGWALSVYLKFLAAGLGAYLLLRVLRYPSFIAAVCGVVYLCSGYSVLYALHPHTNVFAVLPWLAATAIAFIRKPSAGRALFVVLTAAMATAGGHPETLFIGVLATALLVVVTNRATTARTWLGLSGAALAGFLLLGVTLVPFAVIALQSDTASSRPDAPAGGFRLVALPGQILPGYLGTPVADELDLTGMLPNAENMSLRSGGFIGAIALLTMLVGFRERVLLIAALVCLGLSLRPPGVSLLLKKLPVVSVVAQEYFALAFVLLSLVPLAAALASLHERKPARKLGVAVLVFALLASAATASLAAPFTRGIVRDVARRGIAHLQQRGHFQQAPEVYEQRLDGYLLRGRMVFIRRFALPALAWALAGAALLSLKRRTTLLGLAIALEMLVFGWHLLPVVNLDNIPQTPPPPIGAILAADPTKRWLLAAPQEIYPANLSIEHRLRQVDSYDVLQSTKRVVALKRAGFNALTGFPAIPSERHIAALRGLGVRFYLSRSAIPNVVRIGGGAPPAVGVYEIAQATPTPLPANSPAEGLFAGSVVTAVGIALAVFVAMTTRRLQKVP